GDESDLREDVDGGEVREGEDQRAEEGEGDGAEEYDERIAKALELRREEEIDGEDGDREDAGEGLALAPDLARLAGVVDRVVRRQDPLGRLLEDAQARLLRRPGHEPAEHAKRVALLESPERAGRRLVDEARDRRERQQLAGRRSDPD